MKKVHIVPHTHWDREWYFTTEETRILLVNNIDEILEFLETNKDYPFYVLDGQTAILEDYFAVKPENKKRVKRLVKEGRLLIGPWYTQTDEMIVGAESIVRNLLYGIKDCEEFGDYMKIGYLPDSFGQTAQLPQILNGFDIKHAVFWRGKSKRHGTDKNEFIWQSDDGSEVLAQVLPLAYSIGKYLPEDEKILKKRMDKFFEILDKTSATKHIILPNGHDQMPIQKNILVIIEKLKKLYPNRDFFLSRYENALEGVSKNNNLATIKGEFLDGRYMRVHRSIYSTRMDIKASNTKIENKITNILEPLATIAHNLGFEYHHGLIKLIWKEIMKNHAHDSIGCCCSDEVHQEIVSRFFIAKQKTDKLIEFYMRKIADSIKTKRKEDILVAFNLLTYQRDGCITASIVSKYQNFRIINDANVSIAFNLISKEIVDPGIIDRQIVAAENYEPFYKYTFEFKDEILAMGYQTYFIEECNLPMENKSKKVQDIETNYYKIKINENGTLDIFDKQTNQSFSEVFMLENCADDGDEYDFSPLPLDEIIYSKDVKAKYKASQSQFTTNIKIQKKLKVPSDLENRKKGIIDSFVDTILNITIENHKPLIKVKMQIDNHAKDHRLRILVPTKIASKCSISDNQFGFIKRDTYDKAMDVWEEEKWHERPDTIYPMLNFVGLSNKEYGVSILTNSTREFQIVGDNYDTIALTLFRSIGVLGKEELQRRPGRPSGIKLLTPDAQLLGKIHINFALYIHPKMTLKADVAKMAKEYTTPVFHYNKIAYNALRLNDSGIKAPLKYSLIKEDSSNLVLSVLKKSEDQDDIILRYYNPTDQKQEVSLKANINKAYVTNLNEKILEKIPVKEKQVNLSIIPNQVRTLMIEMKKHLD